MKNLATNILVGLLSTICSFYLFTQYYQPIPPESFKEDLPVQFVKQDNQPLVNTRPLHKSEIVLPDFREVSKKATNSVVNITVFSATGYRVASGSGVIISSDGFIVTNNHVVEDGSRLEVALPDKRQLNAKVIGRDPSTDLAVIQIDTRGLSPISFGNSDQVDIGEWVLAVGNPFNLTSTVTAGIVSAKARNIRILRSSYSIESFIQTDAVVNPGNSGGALVNTNGELIGINTAIISESGGYEGYSFAIPSNLVRKVIADLREYGEVRRAVLGVIIEDVTGELADALDLPAVSGVYINKVSQNSSADNAGLKVGDVIIGINGITTPSVPELQEQVALFRPGDSISVDFIRSGRKIRKENIRLKSLESVIPSGDQ
ncbi:MAG: hypothetical protein DHS20C18_29910 [Saprospiraceae bacterium]|nr:MAG: hypothetical protein DHS20C18_29910 [Saprospiraceae bacterium]